MPRPPIQSRGAKRAKQVRQALAPARATPPRAPQAGPLSGGAAGAGGASNDASLALWRTLGDAAAPAARARIDRSVPYRGDAGRAHEVGRLLQSTFAQILARFPARVCKVADVARWLELDRSICQRVVLGVREATDGLGVLERFPGVRGLEQFVAAAQQRGCPGTVARQARRALEEYARLISETGGSRTRLVGHVEALRAQDGWRGRNVSPAEVEKYRRKNYEAAVGFTGLASAARVDLVIVGPDHEHDGGSGRVMTVSATGMIGIEAAPYAMPLTRRSRLPGLTPVPDRTATGAGTQHQRSDLTPDLLLRPFTSDPLPRVTTRTEGEYLIQIFNTDDDVATATPFDVVAGMAFSWIWGTPPAPDGNFYSVGRIIGPPARKLIFDVYLHRSLPPPLSVAAHVLRPGMQGSLGNARPQSRWFDRLPMEHDLVLLGGAPGARPAEGYPRLGELTRHLVDAMNWNDESFTGYRFEVTYPVFDMEYVIAAEF